MPILKHAKKKLKQDKKRTVLNKKVKVTFKKLVKKAKEEKTVKALSEAFSAVDKAAKKNILHKNKAARLKSDLSKIVEGKKTVAAVIKKAVKKKGTSAKAIKKALRQGPASKTASTGKAKKSTSKKKK